MAGLATAQRANGNLAAAREAVDNGLTRFPENPTLLTEAVAVAKAQDDTAAANDYQTRLDTLSGG